jgi:hypothetical protein
MAEVDHETGGARLRAPPVEPWRSLLGKRQPRRRISQEERRGLLIQKFRVARGCQLSRSSSHVPALSMAPVLSPVQAFN